MDARTRQSRLLGFFAVSLTLFALPNDSNGATESSDLLGDGAAQSGAVQSGAAKVGAAPVGAQQAGVERGRALFERNCVVCHGATGRGDGPAAYLLSPAPRDLGSGRFRLVSTVNGVPTAQDLVASIRDGMLGSAMPPWDWLTDAELADTASYVLHLAVEGQVADMLRRAEEDEDDLSVEEARSIVDARMTPRGAIEIGPAAQADAVTLQEGRRLYIKSCASCHGDDGTGSGAVNLAGELKNEDGTPNSARDFTAGIFKGGSTHADLVRRIVGGLPGSPMPATSFDDPTQVAPLVAFVRSLVKPGAQERLALRRRTVPALHSRGPLPTDPSDAKWASVEGVWIALTPLWWRSQRVEGVVVRAAHDGTTLAVRMSWADAIRDDELIGAQAFSDAAALQLSLEKNPPLFTMGAPENPVDMALWRAAWAADVLAARDVSDRWPAMTGNDFARRLGDLYEQSVTARAVGNPQSVAARPSGAEMLSASGIGTVGPREGATSSWVAHAKWENGYWDVVFTRPMRAQSAGEPALLAGTSAFLAFAVWDGSFADRNGQKSVSVWHRFEIAP